MFRSKILFLFFLLSLALGLTEKTSAQSITYFKEAKGEEILAVKELQRYLYLRTGKLPAVIPLNINSTLPSNSILVASLNSIRNFKVGEKDTLPVNLGEQEYLLKSTLLNQLLIIGGSRIAVLYGTYKFLESTGIGYALDGDIIPDVRLDSIRIAGFNKTYKPVFKLRGILPFHDFPEGPDWWSEDEYKAIITQLPKMGMNFIGFHAYSERAVNNKIFPFAQPLVWTGSKDQFNPDGTVKSAYPVSHANTRDSSLWAYNPKKTSDFNFGASQLFAQDDFGADYMQNMSPWPRTEKENIGIFNKMGSLLNRSFTLARSLSVKTCIGTETPLTIPTGLKEQFRAQGKNLQQAGLEAYEAMFSRIKATHLLDYYWIWTPESWKKGREKPAEVDAMKSDMMTAFKAARNVSAPFTLATCGWVLGPRRDRAEFDKFLPKEMPFSAINLDVGNTPVEPGFKDIHGRPKWQISWVEDDGAMMSPQFWVGRIRKDALDAYQYGCEGLMGIHWRTRILSPGFYALAKAGWDANQYDKPLEKDMRDYPVDDIYLDWARIELGAAASEKAAIIFSKLDGYKTGKKESGSRFFRTSEWISGPGGIITNIKPWVEVEKEFEFIRDFENLKPLISGAGNMDRYQYWLNTFYYARSQGRIGCILGEIDLSVKQLKSEQNHENKRKLAASIKSLRDKAAKEWENMSTYLLQSVNTTGEMGTIANLEQHNIYNLNLLAKNDSLLSITLGKPVPPVHLSKEYKGNSKIVLTAKRTLLTKGENLDMKIRVLTADEIRSATIYWRPLGGTKFNNKPLLHAGRGVYYISLPATAFGNKEFEYYVEVQLKSDRLRYPSGNVNQTVVVW